jgi:hypothetical protein
MKTGLTVIAMIFAFSSMIATTTLPADAKGIDHMIKKKAHKEPAPEAYNHGDYHMVCVKTGDCGNWNLAG